MIGLLLLTAGLAGAADWRVPTAATPSLGVAYTVAQPGDRILVSPGIYDEDLQLVGKDVSFVSTAGPGETLIRGASANGNMIEVWGASIAFEGLRFESQGFSQRLLALDAEARVALVDVQLRGGRANDGQGGHSALVTGGSSLTLTDVAFLDAGNLQGVDGGHVAVYDSRLQATGGVLFANGGATRGGCVFASRSVVTLDDTRFRGCVATQEGGGLYATGWDGASEFGVSITASSFEMDDALRGVDVFVSDSPTWLGSNTFLPTDSRKVRENAVRITDAPDRSTVIANDFLKSEGLQGGNTELFVAMNRWCYTRTTAVDLLGCDGWIEGNRFVDIGSPASMVSMRAGDVVVASNEFLGQRRAPAIWGALGRYTVGNNLVMSAGSATLPAVFREPSAQLVLLYNDFWQDTGDTNGAMLVGNRFDPPLYEDYVPGGDCRADDFTLQLTSTLINAGHPDVPGLHAGSDIGAGDFFFLTPDNSVDLDDDGFYVPWDCDDGADDIYPAAPEICDGVDHDCDGSSGTGDWWYIDGDGDGHGAPTAALYECDQPDGYAASADDCDDGSDVVYPGAAEVCGNALDENCDGWTPACEGSDGDGDGFCAGLACDDGSRPGDCNDLDPTVNPWGIERCNGIDDDCDGAVDDGLSPDADGDGHTALGACAGIADDCNDGVSQIHPGAFELCNGLDDDCDGEADEELVVDEDGDGWPAASGCQPGGALDCDDTDPDVHPQADEVAGNGVDEDCDGRTDEDPTRDDDDGDGYCEAAQCDDLTLLTGDCDDTDPAVSPGSYDVPGDHVDNDCDGTVDNGQPADQDGDGYSLAAGDCNDLDPQINPGVSERCNGVDDDCSGYLPTDEWDQDRDGWRVCEGDCDDLNNRVHPYQAEDCADTFDNDCDGTVDQDSDADADGVTTCQGDCRDGDPNIHPGAPEICNGLDDNCDGQLDEGYDLDGDGVLACGACDLLVDECDCDDVNALVRPGRAEVCGDGFDNDCNGLVDDTSDDDGDGWATCDGDCDDGDARTSPVAPELCDGRDNDCDGEVDDGFDRDADDVASCRGDCDDDEPSTWYGAPELCDGLDNDCNHVPDDPWPDDDRDGFNECEGDCDESDADIAPDVDEDCSDGNDNDCDGATDLEDEQCSDSGDTDAVTDALPPAWFCDAGRTSPLAAAPWALALLGLGLRRRRPTASG